MNICLNNLNELPEVIKIKVPPHELIERKLYKIIINWNKIRR